MTPIEHYKGIWVKRDDLCFDSPAPPFSKCRGVLKHLQQLKKEGFTNIGYTETSISMAGWGVTWACKQLGLNAILFDPRYKNTPEVLAYHRTKWKELGAIIIPIKAGMAKVNWHISKKILLAKYPKSILLPLGLPFEETIQATCDEFIESGLDLYKTLVVNVGSGTICAGIIRGMVMENYTGKLIGVLGRTSDLTKKRKTILQKANIMEGGFFTPIDLALIDEGWKYTEKSEQYCPFPCHPYYDLKAWEWLIKNKNNLSTPILFWNIGH
jgi:hypothetical protein